MRELARTVAAAFERPAAIAWKDLLVFGKQATAWRGTVGAVILVGPLVAFAALLAETSGPWRQFLHVAGLAVAALFSTFSFAVTVPAATSVALERDRDTLPALVVSPLRPGELVLGKLLAALGNALVAKSIVLPVLALAFALGGLEAGFIPRFFLVLTAADVSFASFALYMSSRPLRPPRVGSPAFKLGVSQAQLALQRSVGLSVLGSLVPIYAAIFGLPFFLQNGVPLGRALESAGAIGAIHPLFTVITWGEVNLFGRHVPVWTLACAFHLLLALPLLAGAAEGQRAAGLDRGRLPRLGFTAWFIFVTATAAGALWDGPAEARALVPAILGAALVIFAATGMGLASPRRRPFGRKDVLLALVDPRRAFTSAPETAPGAALVLVLALSPIIFLVAPSTGAAVQGLVALALASIGIATLGARLAARVQARDAITFEKAVARRTPDAASSAPTTGAPAEPEGETEEAATGASTVFILGFAFIVLAPVIAAFGIALASGPIQQLAPLEPVLRGLAVVALAANPFTSVLPLVDPQGILGGFLSSAMPLRLSVEPQFLVSLHMVIWAGILVASLATLRKAPEVKL